MVDSPYFVVNKYNPCIVYIMWVKNDFVNFCWKTNRGLFYINDVWACCTKLQLNFSI